MLDLQSFRVAIVGTGPAAFYAVDHLLEDMRYRIEVDLFERLPNPWGLIRTGVAADHPDKKGIIDRHFAHLLRHERVRFFGATTIGEHISADDLAQWYDAVIYAVGADSEAELEIPGEDLPGCSGARAFVAWCNGHPDFSHLNFDLSHPRAVVVGNGNVALDVARLLVSPLERLERTDLADHALAALRASKIEEVVVIGRRGAEHAAFNNPEIEEFLHLPGIDVIVDHAEIERARGAVQSPDMSNRARKLATLGRLADRPRTGGRRLEFQFLASPIAIEGNGRAEAIVLRDNILGDGPGGTSTVTPGERAVRLETGLIIRSCGYRRAPFPGLPFDTERNVIANRQGRITSGDAIVPGAYVTGWAKRGCRGIIGTNRKCAGETVAMLLADLTSGALQRHSIDASEVEAIVRGRNPALVVRSGWNRIDRAERDAGRREGRPRIKVVEWQKMLDLAAVEDLN